MKDLLYLTHFNQSQYPCFKILKERFKSENSDKLLSLKFLACPRKKLKSFIEIFHREGLIADTIHTIALLCMCIQCIQIGECRRVVS